VGVVVGTTTSLLVTVTGGVVGVAAVDVGKV